MSIEQTYEFKIKLCDGTEVCLSGNKETVDDVVEDFKQFLLGAGYSPTWVSRVSIDDNGVEHE